MQCGERPLTARPRVAIRFARVAALDEATCIHREPRPAANEPGGSESHDMSEDVHWAGLDIEDRPTHSRSFLPNSVSFVKSGYSAFFHGRSLKDSLVSANAYEEFEVFRRILFIHAFPRCRFYMLDRGRGKRY